MRAGTRRRLRLIAKVIIFGTLVGAAYGIALHLTVYDAPRWGALIGATHGFLISATIGWLEIFGVRTQPGRLIVWRARARHVLETAVDADVRVGDRFDYRPRRRAINRRWISDVPE